VPREQEEERAELGEQRQHGKARPVVAGRVGEDAGDHWAAELADRDDEEA